MANICLHMPAAHENPLNHRMAQVGRELWRSPCPTPLFMQHHLQQAAQAQDQVASEDLQEGDLLG